MDPWKILDSIQDTIHIVDRQRRIIYGNESFRRYVPKSLGDVIGKDMWESFPIIKGTVAEEHCRKAMEGRVASSFEFSTPSGQHFQVRVYPTDDGITIT